MLTHSNRVMILAAIAAVAVVVMFFVDPIPQDPAYHLFADTRRIAGIPNFWDVVSNLPFLLVGIYGLGRYKNLEEGMRSSAYIMLCSGVLLVCFGSAYYHLSPSTASLLWDRLPMTVAFMSLFSMLLDERVRPGARHGSLWPLVIIGIGSAAYWSITESQGHGDLRPYALVQFLPIVLMPLILWLFTAKYLRGNLLMWAFGFYVLAKVFEHFDGTVFEALGPLSGHTIKHLVAGIAVLCVVLAVPVRAEGQENP